MKKNYIYACLIAFAAFCSCTDPASLEVLDAENHYRNSADANSAVVGLYGKFMELAEKVVVLNELRADLMDVTRNADEELQAISYFTSDAQNSWADPTIFYDVIQNCNDILYHFNIMKQESRFPEDTYEELYSDVMTIRCWTYLRLGAIYGKIPYVTDPIESVAKLPELTEASYMNLDALIPELIACMEALPTLEQYSTGSEMNTTLSGYNLTYYTLNKRCLLMELYLWNDEYEKAAHMFRDFNRPYESVGGNGRFKNFGYVYQGSFVGAYMITYTRNMYSDYNSMVSLWKKMFELQINETYANWEHITCLTYDEAYQPTFPFIRLFASEGVGEYLLMPSQNAIENYWGNQVQTNGFEFDGRGLGSSYVQNAQGDNVIQKYLNDYDLTTPYMQSGRWFIYRAGWLNLLYAEACNRVAESEQYYLNDTLRPYSAYRKLAYGMLNTGINEQFAWTKANGDSYPGDSIYVSGWWPGEGGNFPDPYDFDCRYNTTPYCRGPWRDNIGMRERASLTPATWDSTGLEVDFLENAILEELALETAYEGHRWMDIIRIARRQNRLSPGKGTALLNNLMSKKFDKNGSSWVFLDDESNWYLPVSFK